MWGRVIGLGLMLVMDVGFPIGLGMMLVMDVGFPIGLGMMLVKNMGSEDRPDFMGIVPKA